MAQIISLLIGYFIGALVQTSYWYGRRRNADIRKYGSGNAGTTNVMRTWGRKAGIITAIGDVAKVFLSALIAWLIFHWTGMPAMLIFLYSGLGTVIGHIFPFYMGFKGGKGVATTAGVIISLFFLPNACWVMTLIGVITFFGVLIITRYASLASLVLVTEFLIEFIIWSGSGNTELRGGEIAQGICLVIIMTALCYLKHLGNIERLLDGNERKFGEKKRVSEIRDEDAFEEEFEKSADESDLRRSDRRSAAIERRPEEEEYYLFGDEDDAEPDKDIKDCRESFEYEEDVLVDESVFEDEPKTEPVNKDTSPVKPLDEHELSKGGTPERKFIWDNDKQCYVRYKDPDQ